MNGQLITRVIEPSAQTTRWSFQIDDLEDDEKEYVDRLLRAELSWQATRGNKFYDPRESPKKRRTKKPRIGSRQGDTVDTVTSSSMQVTLPPQPPKSMLTLDRLKQGGKRPHEDTTQQVVPNAVPAFHTSPKQPRSRSIRKPSLSFKSNNRKASFNG